MSVNAFTASVMREKIRLPDFKRVLEKYILSSRTERVSKLLTNSQAKLSQERQRSSESMVKVSLNFALQRVILDIIQVQKYGIT